jgi:poly-beta-hydroxyalkanoate depolymerase
MKKQLNKKFEEDFNKSRAALEEIIDHNRNIDSHLVNDLIQGDFKKLEEHIEISKLILEGVKATNELYKQSIDILKNINNIPEQEKEKKSVLADLMKDMDDENEEETKE